MPLSMEYDKMYFKMMLIKSIFSSNFGFIIP